MSVILLSSNDELFFSTEVTPIQNFYYRGHLIILLRYLSLIQFYYSCKMQIMILPISVL